MAVLPSSKCQEEERQRERERERERERVAEDERCLKKTREASGTVLAERFGW